MTEKLIQGNRQKPKKKVKHAEHSIPIHINFFESSICFRNETFNPFKRLEMENQITKFIQHQQLIKYLKPIYSYPQLILLSCFIPIGIVLMEIGLFLIPLLYVIKMGVYFHLLIPLSVCSFSMLLIIISVLLKRKYIRKIKKYIEFLNESDFNQRGFQLYFETITKHGKVTQILMINQYFEHYPNE